MMGPVAHPGYSGDGVGYRTRLTLGDHAMMSNRDYIAECVARCQTVMLEAARRVLGDDSISPDIQPTVLRVVSELDTLGDLLSGVVTV
jgi:hypothetical protein